MPTPTYRQIANRERLPMVSTRNESAIEAYRASRETESRSKSRKAHPQARNAIAAFGFMGMRPGRMLFNQEISAVHPTRTAIPSTTRNAAPILAAFLNWEL